MACTNCGRGAAVEGYTVRFTRETTDSTVMELELCEECAAEFRDERGIEVREL